MSGQSLGTRVSNLKFVALTVLELLAFNSHDRPLRTHTHTQTDTDKQKRMHYLRHSLRSLGGDNDFKVDTNIYISNTETIRYEADLLCYHSHQLDLITDKQFHNLTNFTAEGPIFYGLPKIHKTNIIPTNFFTNFRTLFSEPTSKIENTL